MKYFHRCRHDNIHLPWRLTWALHQQPELSCLVSKWSTSHKGTHKSLTWYFHLELSYDTLSHYYQAQLSLCSHRSASWQEHLSLQYYPLHFGTMWQMPHLYLRRRHGLRDHQSPEGHLVFQKTQWSVIAWHQRALVKDRSQISPQAEGVSALVLPEDQQSSEASMVESYRRLVCMSLITPTLSP